MTTRLLSSVGKRRALSCLSQAESKMPLMCTSRRSYFSTTALRGKYAVVDHSEAYEAAMKGRHGDQLSLALREGVGKDDPPFDPFIEEELAEAAAAEDVEGDYYDDDEEDSDEDEEDLEAEEDLVRYNADGSVRWKKSDLAAFKAGAPAGGLFAIIKLPGTQHKVTVDDVIVQNKLPVETYSLGSVHTLKDVLLVGSSHRTLVGMPVVTGAEVDVMVEEITRDAKVIVFKKRRRKNSQRKKGHRREVTMLRVLDIRMPPEHADHKHVARKETDVDSLNA